MTVNTRRGAVTLGRPKKIWRAALRSFGGLTERDGARAVRVWLTLEREPDRGVTLDLTLDAAETLARNLLEQVEQARAEKE